MDFARERPLPDGFMVGHATRADAGTGCTVVIVRVQGVGG